MKAKDIINEIANSKEYKDLCRNITKGNSLWEDLFQELILILCEKEPAKIEELYSKGQLKWFIVTILQNQYKSNTSDFYKDHIRFSQRSTELFDSPQIEESKEQIEDVLQVVDHVKEKEVFDTTSDWYENKLFKSYLHESSFRKLERNTGISRVAINNTILQYVRKLKQKAETKRIFMEQRFARLELPKNIKEDIFENSLYEEMTIEELLIQQLKIINRALKIKHRTKRIEITQLKIF